MTLTQTPLKSERVIINAPMSFTGAAQRTWRIRRSDNPWVLWLLLTPAAVVLLLPWWAAIVAWYVVFGILLVPYRLLRRGARKRKAEALRHREMLEHVK